MTTDSEPSPKLRIVLADDHRIFLEGLERLLESQFDIVGLAQDGQELLEVALRTKPDLIVTDVSMPKLTGLKAVDRIRSGGLSPMVIILTMHLDPEYATEAIELGVDGYVLKQAAAAELVSAIEEAVRGGRWLSPSLAMKMFDTPRVADEPPVGLLSKLTPRQREILTMLVSGKTAKEIAAELDISRKTVEYHKYRMMGDLGVATSAELIKVAVQGGLAG
jgi:DNA-binding NarL/FixJ family response regulator